MRRDTELEMVPTKQEQPALVTRAREMVAAGQSWRDAASEIRSLAAGDRDALYEAMLYWVRAVGRGPTDDFEAFAALRALEAALADTPWVKG